MSNEDPAEAEFRELYERCHRPVLAYFQRRLPRSEAFDATEEVFLVVWRRLNDVPDGDGALPWLYGIAHNVLLNQQRSARRERRLKSRLASDPIPPMPDTAQQIVDQAEQEAVVSSLSTLPYRDREILRLTYWEELPHAQIADVLGCSVGAVDVRLHRAKRRLRKALARAGHVPSGRPAVLPEWKEEGC